MVSVIEVHQTAALVLKQHGDGAPAWITQRAHELLAVGDFMGVTTWMAVLHVVKEMPSSKPTGSVQLTVSFPLPLAVGISRR